MVRVRAELKNPCSAIAREHFGPSSKEYKRIKALEQWAVTHGYGGYKAINKRTNAQKALQQKMKFKE